MIDRKFKFIAFDPCKGTIYTEENAIVFLAKDRAVLPMLFAYIEECKRLECGQDHIESVELLRKRVNNFQGSVGSRIPDTETDCEIDRCIGGNV